MIFFEVQMEIKFSKKLKIVLPKENLSKNMFFKHTVQNN